MNEELKKLKVDDSEYTTEVPEGSIKSYQGMPDPTEVKAFIPGTIVEVRVSQGDFVEAGDVLLLLDAMKMHNEICSGASGRIAELLVSKGDVVKKGQLLVHIRRSTEE
jgi:biotin carboxyl carrier protein